MEVKRDEEIRVIELPEDFGDILEKNEAALRFYNELSYSAKRKYFQLITSAKKAETRKRRILEAVEKLEDNIKL